MHIVFVVAALLLALVSITEVSEATLGVWMIGAACLCGILARLIQADRHVAKLISKN